MCRSFVECCRVECRSFTQSLLSSSGLLGGGLRHAPPLTPPPNSAPTAPGHLAKEADGRPLGPADVEAANPAASASVIRSRFLAQAFLSRSTSPASKLDQQCH